MIGAVRGHVLVQPEMERGRPRLVRFRAVGQGFLKAWGSFRSDETRLRSGEVKLQRSVHRVGK